MPFLARTTPAGGFSRPRTSRRTRPRRLRTLLAGSLSAAAALLLAPSLASAAVTHEWLGEIPNAPYWSGVTVGPTEPEPATEKAAVFVAGEGVQRFDSSNAPLPFSCGTACETYVEGNRIKGTPTGGEFPRTISVAVDDATGDIFVSGGSVGDRR